MKIRWFLRKILKEPKNLVYLFEEDNDNNYEMPKRILEKYRIITVRDDDGELYDIPKGKLKKYWVPPFPRVKKPKKMKQITF